MKRPSKKILFILLACIVAVGGIYLAVRLTNEEKMGEQERLTQATLQIIADQSSTADTDGDGLRDWEEGLWGTDTTKADTDGDGTNDGEEVAAGRNPVVKGPDDTYVTGQPGTGTLAATSTSGLSSTDKLAQDFFAQYMSLKQQGVEMSPETQAQIVDSLLADNALSLTAKVYTVNDIHHSAPNDPTSIRVYGNELGVALKKNSPKDLTNELVILGKALRENDEKELVKLDTNIAAINGLLNDLVAMNVPKGAASVHLNLVNALSATLEGVRAMRDMFTDPVRGYAGINEYQTDATILTLAISDINQYFLRNAVTFEQQEDGYAFVHSI